MNTNRLDPLWTVQDLAEYLNVPMQTIYDWRHKHCAPTGIKIGRHLRFRESDVMAWLAAQAA